MLGISSKLENLPGQLSGGDGSRGDRALATKPAILLCDEPTGKTLGQQDVTGCWGCLKVTSQQYAQTIVMITHNEESLSLLIESSDRGRQIEPGGQEA